MRSCARIGPSRVIAQVPVDVATYLFNEKREWLRTLEDKSEIELIIVPNENMQTPEYSIRRVRDDEAGAAREQAAQLSHADGACRYGAGHREGQAASG